MQPQTLYNLSQLTSFRRELHAHPELSFQESATQARIRVFLESLGIPPSSIRICAKTGLIVDITGKAKPEGAPRLIAFRADIDALEMLEHNPDLPYKSTNPLAAHACGHDGHVTCLLGFACLFLDSLSLVPSNKTIRLLFQPSEEDTPGDLSGADCMVMEGCLEGVDEVYGLHNCPLKFGKCFVKGGYVAAEFLNIRLKIHGAGGHAGDPNVKGDPVQPSVDIYVMLRELIRRETENKRYFCFSLPYFHAGTANNVIAEWAEIKGTFRSVDSEFTKKFVEEFTEKAKKICQEHSCQLEISCKLTCPAIVNSEKESENLRKIAMEFFGEVNVGDELFPVLGSDDFAFFSNQKPGVYFGVGVGRPDRQLHAPNFDFNDEAIDFIARFWLRIAEDRLGFSSKGLSENPLFKKN